MSSAASTDQGKGSPGSLVYWSQVVGLVGYSVMSGFFILLLCYLRLNRHVALRGNESAARKAILPAYEPLVAVLAIETLGFVLFLSVAVPIKLYTAAFPPLIAEMFYSGRQFVFVTIVVFMLQKSVSLPAMRRTMIISFALGSYTIPAVAILSLCFSPGSHTLFWITGVCRRLLLILYVYVFCKPPTRANVQSMRAYCVYIIIYHVLIMIYSIMAHYHTNVILASAISYTVVVWGSICPLWIWRVLRADSEYWRGMGRRACSLQAMFRQKRAMDEQISSHGLHVLIEMHRKYIIDFAHLEVKSRIGVGASAVVFAGVLKNQRPVAIKMYTPRSFTEDTVAQFSHEAAFCATLHHPNVIEFIGMCVNPPTISLVAELCHASLDNVLEVHAHGDDQYVSPCWPSRGQYDSRALLRIAYMLDAARAVAYLHSFSPPLLHRDIKPANFLVDVDSNVKLTDFGESRRLPRQRLPPQYEQQYQQQQQQQQHQSSPADRQSDSSRFTMAQFNIRIDPLPPPSAMMTVTGTVHYMAPEMIRGRSGLAAYGQAADVYSLAITLWDILYPQHSKFPDMHDEGNHFLVLERVLSGTRPGFSNDVHPKLRDLITCAWNPDPSCRPTAQQIVTTLESVQEEVLSMLAFDLSDDLGRLESGCCEDSAISEDTVVNFNLFDEECGNSFSHGTLSCGGLLTPRVKTVAPPVTFTGEYAIERMEEMLGIDPLSGESIRLGNALMDAGFLHHSTHSQCFEFSSSSLYFFDRDNISFCQPLAMLEDKSGYSAYESCTESLLSPSVKGDHDMDSLGPIREGALSDGPPLIPKKERRKSRLISRIASTLTSYSSVPGSQRRMGRGDIFDKFSGTCVCRRFAQRLEVAHASPDAQRARHERMKHVGIGSDKWRPLSDDEEDSVHKLLTEEVTHPSSATSDIEMFDLLPIVTPAA